MSADSIYKRLVDSFRDLDDERKLERQSSVVLPEGIASWSVIRHSSLPKGTLMVSDDVWEHLKLHCDDTALVRVRKENQP